MPDEVEAFARREEAQRVRDEVDDLVEAARSCGAQEGFELGKGHFDGVEVWTVRRQEAQARADPLNRGLHLRVFVDGEIVEHHHVAGLQGRDEDLLDIGEKRGVVERAVEDRRGPETPDAQRGDHRVRLPVAAGGMVPKSRTARAAAIPPQQIRGDAGLIDEDVAARVVDRLRVAPVPAGGRDIRSALFVGVNRFF